MFRLSDFFAVLTSEENVKVNKMTIDNLAIIVGQALVRSPVLMDPPQVVAYGYPLTDVGCASPREGCGCRTPH